MRRGDSHYTRNGRRYPCLAPTEVGQCRNCGVAMPPGRAVCSTACRAALGGYGRGAAGRRRQPCVETPGAVAAFLDRAVELECAPPWVRHPEPWTDVVVRRGARA